MATSTPSKTVALKYQELNEDAGQTIIFFHGAHSSGDEWDLVAHHMSETYHLLLPDLPAHGKSFDIRPFSLDLSARLSADLIRSRAKNGKAHVVGHSMGAQVAIALASRYPDLVDTVYVSGYGVSSSSTALAYGLWVQNHLTAAVPTVVLRWLTDGTDLTSSDNKSLAVSKEIANALSFTDDGWPAPWPARTLIIAAGKSGILPTADSVADAKRLTDIGQRGNEATIAFSHPDMRHPWSRQDPKLYAQTITQWFEQGTVSAGFKQI